MESIEIKLVISACNKMIDKYINGKEMQCPVCKIFYEPDLGPNCKNCFNRIESRFQCSCIFMNTFPEKRDFHYIRALYWGEIKKYLEDVLEKSIYPNNFIPIQTLRDKCNEIDQKIL